ncbi:MAG: D-aminoacylase [Acidobacteriota bacterium]
MRRLAWVAGLFACAALSAAGARAQDFDLLLQRGKVVDGTGNPWFRADVGIKAGKIAAIGDLKGKTATRTIDAAGLVVAPGFIDIHNHSDETLLADGNAQSMVRQGVTSMIFGEGGSAAPSKEFPRLRDYFAALLAKGISTNIGTYVGSSQIWEHVRGSKPAPPEPAELERMRVLVREAMTDGALGVASSLSGPPGTWIDTNSMVEMCKQAAPFGGIYSTHMRTEGNGVFKAVAESLDIGKRAGVPVDIIHLKIAEHTLWGKMPELVASIQNARNQGQQVTANVYPYRAGQNNLSSIVPPWAHEGGRPDLLKRLADASLRDRLQKEIREGIPGTDWYNHYTATGSWEGMLLVNFSNPAYKQFEGKRMNQVIAALLPEMQKANPKANDVDVLFRVLLDNRGSVPTVYFHHSEQDMRYALAQPFVSIGSDGTAVATEGPLARGNPHPRYYGTFPRVLGRYVREEHVLTLEEAIRKMTSANAAKLSLWDRGVLRPGMAADVAVFNAETIIDHATFEKPHQYAEGIEFLVVNGKLVLERGRHTNARPGVILYGQGHAH